MQLSRLFVVRDFHDFVITSLSPSLPRLAGHAPALGWGGSSDQWGSTMSKLVTFFKDESGASAAEYALILAIVGAGIATAMTLLGTNIAAAITKAANLIQ
jgi:pilus assembly protein Flp/PilA